MRARPLLLAILTFAATPVFAADFVVTYDRAQPRFGKPQRTVLRQHQQRMRFDDVGRDGDITQTFTSPGQTVKFEVVRGADGAPRSISLIEDPPAAPAPEARRTYSGETRVLLGERCRSWTARFTPTLAQTGCRTDDGVELLFQDAPYGERTALSVERRTVDAKDVAPPIALLDLVTWAPSGPQDHSHDFRVQLGLMEMRRSGSWIRTDETYNGVRTRRIVDTATGVILTYATSGGGNRQLTITRDPAQAAFTGDAMPRLAQMIGGQTCRWWDMAARVMDYAEKQCRTADGAILRIERSGRAGERVLEAAAYEQGPQPWKAIAPEAEIASPAAWGL